MRELYRRSKFVACIREKSSEGINGRIVPSTDFNGITEDFHLFDYSGKVSIHFQRRKVLCVYEFETFDNSQIDLTKTNWLQENRVRLIYAEDFQ